MALRSPILQPAYRREPLIATVKRLGFSPHLCLDAGDRNSFDPDVDATRWRDTSGNAHHFLMTDAPTFVGVPGGLSEAEYFLFDGTNYLTLDGANPAWVEALHKSGFSVSVLFVVMTAGAAGNGLLGTAAGVATIGIQFFANGSSGAFSFQIADGTGAYDVTVTNTAAAVTDGVWQILGRTFIDGAANQSFFQKNSFQASITTISGVSLSALDATHTLCVGATGNGVTPIPNGGRMAAVLVLPALSATNMNRLVRAIRGRWPTMAYGP